MTDVPLTIRGSHSRSGIARKAASAVSAFAAKIVQPHKAVLSNLASIPLTVAGIACADTGAFLASTIAGWIFTGVTLLVLEHLIADE